MVLLNAEVAEFLLPHSIVHATRRKDLVVNLHKLISVQEVFIKSNKLKKSIRIILDAFNELRACHVVEGMHESSKYKPTSFSKSRSSTGKGKEIAATSSAMSLSKFMWDKVYWPSLDYLTVAKSSI